MNINRLPLIKCKNLSTVSRLKDADVIILGAPLYGGSYTTFISPSEIMRILSDKVEDNISEDKFKEDLKLFDLGDLTSYNIDDYKVDVETVFRHIKNNVNDPRTIVIGGDHLISYHLIKIIKPDVLIIFDAHLDLKDSYMFNKFNNATVMRRIREIYNGPMMYFGVRAFDKEEIIFANRDRNIMIEADDMLSKYWGSKAYVSIDVDALDPSLMHQVDYPETMGYKFQDLVDKIRRISEFLDLRAVDIVEYNPKKIDYSEINLLLKLLFISANEMTKSKKRTSLTN